MSRVTSAIVVRFPISRRAPASASALDSPRSIRSRTAIDRCDWSSVFSSSSRFRRQLVIYGSPRSREFGSTSRLASLSALEDAADGLDELRPSRSLGEELAAPAGREAIDARALVVVGGLP